MRKLSGLVLMIMTGGACAGLIWTSHTLADLVRRPSLSWPSVLTGAPPDERSTADAASSVPSWTFTAPGARWRTGWTPGAHSQGRTDVARSTMPAASLEPQAYSMTAPQFLSDPTASAAEAIAVGDVSGDGRDDLVFLSRHPISDPQYNRMKVYAAYQRGDGRLDPAVKIAELGNEFEYQLKIADLDRNGVGDIITTVFNDIIVLRSNPDGTFTSSTAAAGDPYELVVTDVDRDGYLDVLADSSNASATVIHGGPNGIDHTSTLPLPSSAVRTIGDVTGDGLDDLILAVIFNRPLEEFRIYPALASGGYAAPVVLSLPLGSNQASSLAVGDFNADGRGDLMLDEANDYANLRMYLQDSQGNLSPSVDIARQRGSGSLIADDLDRDGRTDVAIAHAGWGYIGYYLQTDAGFPPETVIQAYQHHGRVNFFAAGDLNHDGCGDLAISRMSQSPVLLYGQGCVLQPVIADCRYPAVEVEEPGLKAPGLPSPLASARNGDAGTKPGTSLIRNTAARFARSGYGVRGMPSPGSTPSNREGRTVMAQ